MPVSSIGLQYLSTFSYHVSAFFLIHVRMFRIVFEVLPSTFAFLWTGGPSIVALMSSQYVEIRYRKWFLIDLIVGVGAPFRHLNSVLVSAHH